MEGTFIEEIEEGGCEERLGVCQRRWRCRNPKDGFKGQSELTAGKILGEDLSKDVSVGKEQPRPQGNSLKEGSQRKTVDASQPYPHYWAQQALLK